MTYGKHEMREGIKVEQMASSSGTEQHLEREVLNDTGEGERNGGTSGMSDVSTDHEPHNGRNTSSDQRNLNNISRRRTHRIWEGNEPNRTMRRINRRLRRIRNGSETNQIQLSEDRRRVNNGPTKIPRD